MNVLEARRRMLGAGVYKKTVTGNPAIAQGSMARMYPGIEMQGWTEQDSTTGAQLLNLTENTVTDSGITCVSEGSTITISGERVIGDGGRLTYVTSTFTLQPGTYGFSYEKFNDVNSSILNAILMKQADNEILDNTFTLAEETNLYIGVNIVQGKTADNAIIRCMLNAGSEALPYEPYTGSKPSPSPDYPQEIVSAGTQNQDTGKWEYEITITNTQTDPDKNQTVLLTSDRPLTKWDKLEKRNGQWEWVYKSNEVVFDGSEVDAWELYNNGFYISGGLKDITLDTTLHAGSLSDKFHYGRLGDYAYFRVTNTVSSYSPIFYYNGIADVESWKKFLTENNVSFLYPTEAETFIPLTETEQEQMNALHTNRPTTILSNDAGCEMTLTYKTKKSLEVTA